MEKGFILSLIFAAIVAIFALNNSYSVSINLLFTKVEISQALVILISALLGAIVAAMFSGVRSLKSNRKIKNLNQEIEDLDVKNKELINLSYDKDQQIKILSKEIVDSGNKGIKPHDENIEIINESREKDSLTYPGSGFNDKN